MTSIAILKKMGAMLNSPVQYFLETENGKLLMNELIGSNISIKFMEEIICIKCGNKTRKSFGQGYCYTCFISAPETEDCVLRPELCKAHLGIARDMEYASEHCLSNHFVYLASSSGIKVGVTRMSQIPTRWIDQGASSAMKIACTPNRFTAGLIEVALKKHLPDKTNWRLMLTNRIDQNPEFEKAYQLASTVLNPELKQFLLDDNFITSIEYPVLQFPTKVESIDLEKTSEVSGTLSGIKGQYLIFVDGKVINIRKHTGYKVTIK